MPRGSIWLTLIAWLWISAVQARTPAANHEPTRRAPGLWASFDRHALRLHDRTAVGSAALLELRLTGVGRGTALAPPSEGELFENDTQAEIRRPGLVEWYRSDARGVEQGFTVSMRPPGAGDLVLELELGLGRAFATSDGARLTSQRGRSFSYGELFAQDVWGAQLPARVAVVDPQRLRLVVADADATYPIVVDPLISATADFLIESNQIKAELNAGENAGDVNNDGYDDLIVGAFDYDNGQHNEGAAWVYLGGPTGIDPNSPNAFLEANEPMAEFGGSVAGLGDINCDGYDDVIVGARAWEVNNQDLTGGAVFIYHGGPTGVHDGTMVLVGAVSTPSATAETILTSSLSDSHFGDKVSGAGDVNADGCDDVIIGDMRWESSALEQDEGAAFVFYSKCTCPNAPPIDSGTSTTANVILQYDSINLGLGSAVDAAGDVNDDAYDDVIVGAWAYNSGGQSAEGAAFLYFGGPGGLATSPGAIIESDEPGARAGRSVAGAGDVNGDGVADMIVGAPYYLGKGAALVFHGGAGFSGGGAAAADAILASDQIGSEFGLHVAGAGDVNGDGKGDVVVGSWLYDTVGASEGAAFVFLGSSTGIQGTTPAAAYARLESDQPGSDFGIRVGGGADIDNDGLAEVIVGASEYDNGVTQNDFDEGVAFVYLGVSDQDGDRLSDAVETNTDIFIDPSNTGTDPLDTDSDGDGASDGDEVLVLGTDPNLADTDGDTLSDGSDTCPFVANLGQNFNSDLLPAGDFCQCGDLDEDGDVDGDDVLRARKHVVGSVTLTPSQKIRCNVIGLPESQTASNDCDVADVMILSRYTSGLETTIANVCDAYGAP